MELKEDRLLTDRPSSIYKANRERAENNETRKKDEKKREGR